MIIQKILFFLLLFAASANAANTLGQIKHQGFIKVGTTGDYAPQSWLNPATGFYEGFDTELTEDLAKSLKIFRDSCCKLNICKNANFL